MENSNNNFETLAYTMQAEEELYFAAETNYFPGPDDEDEGEDEDNSNADETKDAGDDNPPLDDDVVHSPLTTQSGGKPK